jgi:hypothetical protein
MARYGAIAAVGESVARFLRSALAGAGSVAPQVQLLTTRTLQAASGADATFTVSANGAITLLLYRVDIDPSQPNPVAPDLDSIRKGFSHSKRHLLPLNLRYLLTAWADQSEMQTLLLGQALAALHGHANFGASSLVNAIGGATDIWRPDESFQFVPDDMQTEDLYQIWESVGRPFELSVPFKARGVRLEADLFDGDGIVVRRDLVYGPAGDEDGAVSS